MYTESIHDKQQKYASDENMRRVETTGRISGLCGYGDSVGIPTGFFGGYGMGTIWGLKSNPISMAALKFGEVKMS